MQPSIEITHPLPWQEQVWKQLQHAQAADRLPHALLLTGPAGVGKRLFASHLSRLLLCQSPNWSAIKVCEKCDACVKTLHAAHPDYRELRPQEDKREITVDDVRNILNYIQISSQVSGGYKVLLIDPADGLNRNAGNALLKTLEEPPKNRIIILVAESLGNIPATIRSRCQLVRFSSVRSAALTAWLSGITQGKYDGSKDIGDDGAPLLALARWQEKGSNQNDFVEKFRAQWLNAMQGKQSPLDVAQQWAETDDETLLINWFQTEIKQALEHFTGLNPGVNSGNKTPMLMATGMTGKEVLIIQNKINEIASILSTTANSRLIWEAFLLNCHRMSIESKVA